MVVFNCLSKCKYWLTHCRREISLLSIYYQYGSTGKRVQQGCTLSPYLTYMQSISWEMPGWMTHKLESRLPGEISTTSDILIVVVQLLSHVWLFSTPWTTAHQASLSLTISHSLLQLMSIESVLPTNHLTLCRPLLLLPSIFHCIRLFSNEVALCHQVAKALELQLRHQFFQ